MAICNTTSGRTAVPELVGREAEQETLWNLYVWSEENVSRQIFLQRVHWNWGRSLLWDCPSSAVAAYLDNKSSTPRVRWVLPRLCSGAEFPMIWMGNSSINEGMSIAIFDYLRARLSIARVFILLPERCWKRSQSHSQNLCTIYPLVIEHSHGKWPIYRWFTYWKWWFFMAMLNNQRVCIYIYMSIVHCSDMPRPRRGMSCSPTTFSLYMSTLPILNSNWQGL